MRFLFFFLTLILFIKNNYAHLIFEILTIVCYNIFPYRNYNLDTILFLKFSRLTTCNILNSLRLL